jgi:hypothetical protein
MRVEQLSDTTYRFKVSGEADGEPWRIVFDLTPDNRETNRYTYSGNWQDFPIREFTWGDYDLREPGGPCRAQLNRAAAPYIILDLDRLDAERAEGAFQELKGIYYDEANEHCSTASPGPFSFTVPVE